MDCTNEGRPPQDEEPLESTGSEPVKTERPCGTETVLLVEDDPGIRALLRYTLRLHGYTVLEAKDGPEALRLAGQYADPIHLILTDMVMPLMGGKEIVARLEPDRPQITALYMSGYAAEGRAAPPTGTGPHPLLLKPFSPDTLIRMVRDVLDGARGKEDRIPGVGAL